jgi:hypothetical protein
MRRPVCPQRKYTLEGWIRRTSPDHIMSQTFYVGALLWTFDNLVIRDGAKWNYYYFVNG